MGTEDSSLCLPLEGHPRDVIGLSCVDILLPAGSSPHTQMRCQSGSDPHWSLISGAQVGFVHSGATDRLCWSPVWGPGSAASWGPLFSGRWPESPQDPVASGFQEGMDHRGHVQPLAGLVPSGCLRSPSLRQVTRPSQAQSVCRGRAVLEREWTSHWGSEAEAPWMTGCEWPHLSYSAGFLSQRLR